MEARQRELLNGCVLAQSRIFTAAAENAERCLAETRGLWRIGISRFSIKSILLGGLCVSNESCLLQDEWAVKILRLFHATGRKWMQVSPFTPLTFRYEGGYDHFRED